MRSLWLQTRAVAAMNVKSLPDRVWPSAAAAGALALTVLVLLGFLAMSTGIRTTLSGSGREDVALILQEGSPDEASSQISREEMDVLAAAPQIRRHGDAAVVSPERFVVVKGLRRGSGQEANLALRGVGRFGLSVRPGLRVTAGRPFAQGSDEMIVGRALAKRFEGYDVGRSVRIGSKTWRVVGVFEDGGSVNESEALAPIDTLQSFYGGGQTYQSVRALLQRPSGLAGLQGFAKADPRTQVSVISERDYLAKQSASVGVVLRVLAWPLAIAMAAGALVGALNTMYSSVAARSGEIATLRAIGFSPLAAFAGSMAEAVALAVIGGAAGCAIAVIAFHGLTSSTIGGNFTQVVFRWRLSAADLQAALTLAVVVGALGGVLPGLKAARTPLTGAHHE